MTVIHVSPRARTLTAALAVAALTLVVAQPAGAEPDTVSTLRTFASDHGDYGVVLGRHSVGGGLQVTAYNHSADPQDFGMGSDLTAQGEVSHLWLLGIPELAETFEVVLQPGESTTRDIPTWPGETYTFFTDAGGSQPELGTYTVAGEWQPVAFVPDADDQLADVHVGYDLRTSTGSVPAGGRIEVNADIPDQSSLRAYIVPESDIQNAFDSETYVVDPHMAAGLKTFPDAAQVRTLNPIPVDSTGVHGAVVDIPVDLAPGQYGLFLGDKARGYYPVGPYSSNQNTNLVVTPRGTTASGTDVAITPVDQTGNTPVDFTFSTVSQGGTTTVSTSSTGPAATGFSLLAGSPTYYELATTATFSGTVRLCVHFDPGSLDAAAASSQHLYHYTGGAWTDITRESGYGYACGDTTSFSPFAIGTPTPVAPTLKFLTPARTSGNTAIAGAPYPVTFKGKAGVKVAAGSPVSQRIDCRTGAAIGAATPSTRPGTKPYAYLPKLGVYTYLWETARSWRGTCRSFTLKLDSNAGTGTSAFTFR